MDVALISAKREGFYASRLKAGRLSSMVSELLCTPAALQFSLHEELALARATVADLLQIYDRDTLNKDGELSAAQTILYGERLRDAIESVSRIAKRAVEVETGKSIQPAMIAALAASIQGALNDVVKDDATRAQMVDRLEASFHNLAMTQATTNTEVLSPSETVAAMYATIPYVPEPEVK